MLRILFGALALLLFVPAVFACDGQTGKVIFEDKFTDDAGGWEFSAAKGLALKAPGAALAADASDGGKSRTQLNQTFTATQGDFCVEMSFPTNAAQLDASIGVNFWATDYFNFWVAFVTGGGQVNLLKLTNNKWSTVWSTTASNLVKSGPTDVNSVRAVVKNGTITVIVNGQTVKNVRAPFPAGDLNFGFLGQYARPSSTPVVFPVRSYKVTAGE